MAGVIGCRIGSCIGSYSRRGRSGNGARRSRATRPSALHPAAGRRPPRGFFSAAPTQHMAGTIRAKVPLADLGAAGATLGTLLLWALALHLLA